MEMVSGDVSFLDIHIHRRTSLADQFAKTQCNLAVQDWFTLLGNPNQVVLEIIDRVRSFSIIHALIVLRSAYSFKSSIRKMIEVLKTACLKGRGFNPIYRQ